MRPPTREDCRLEPGLKGQPGGTFYWLKKERCFHQWALYGQGSRAAADRVCRCQPNPATFGRTTHKHQDKPAHLPLSSEDAVRASCQSERTASSSGRRDGWALREWGAGCTFSSVLRCRSCCSSHRRAASRYHARSFLEIFRWEQSLGQRGLACYISSKLLFSDCPKSIDP